MLAILRTAARKPGDLDALLLSEVVERLRPLARSGFIQRAIARRPAVRFGAKDAGLIAAALASADTAEALRPQVEVELAGGRRRGAQRLAAGLPADDPLRERIAALDAEVTSLGQRADQELARAGVTRRRAAGPGREHSSRRSRTGRAAGRRAASPPREAVGRMDGDHMLITWKPSTASTGPVQYRVIAARAGLPDRPPKAPLW